MKGAERFNQSKQELIQRLELIGFIIVAMILFQCCHLGDNNTQKATEGSEMQCFDDKEIIFVDYYEVLMQ